eukprot:TCONS_00027232-protein
MVQTVAGSFKQQVLDAHNSCRQKHGTPPLQWSDVLAQQAQSWADKIAKKGKFEHSPSKLRKGQGENIACAGGKELTGEDAVKMWYDEIKDFNFKNVKYNSKCGHFSQMVWVSTTEIGAGKGTAKNGMQFVVCRYNPAGNMLSEFKNNVKPPGAPASTAPPPKQQAAAAPPKTQPQPKPIKSQPIQKSKPKTQIVEKPKPVKVVKKKADQKPKTKLKNVEQPIIPTRTQVVHAAPPQMNRKTMVLKSEKNFYKKTTTTITNNNNIEPTITTNQPIKVKQNQRAPPKSNVKVTEKHIRYDSTLKQTSGNKLIYVMDYITEVKEVKPKCSTVQVKNIGKEAKVAMWKTKEYLKIGHSYTIMHHCLS